jgi:hypothetical protein
MVGRRWMKYLCVVVGGFVLKLFVARDIGYFIKVSSPDGPSMRAKKQKKKGI